MSALWFSHVRFSLSCSAVQIGHSEQELTKLKIPYKSGTAKYEETAKGQMIGGPHIDGFLKVLFCPTSHKLLGASCIGEQATEIIHIGQAVMSMGGTIEYFRDSVQVRTHHEQRGTKRRGLGGRGPAVLSRVALCSVPSRAELPNVRGAVENRRAGWTQQNGRERAQRCRTIVRRCATRHDEHKHVATNCLRRRNPQQSQHDISPRKRAL